MTNIINGKEIAANLRNEIKKEVVELKNKYGNIPGLAVVQVGNNPASSVYVKNKTKNALEVGIDVIDHHKEESITQNDLLKLIDNLNHEKNVSGILVQLPLPKHINEQTILDSINPEKDADGFHPFNVGKLSIASQNNEKLLMPCTPYGCLLMLKKLNISLQGKNAIIIGRSNIVGKPMAQLLLKESCTVTIAHSKTLNLPDICKNADILVAAIGKPEIVRGSWIKEGSIIIDVGINRIEVEKEGQKKTMLVGDVNYKEAEKKASAITPVPGGVGPMTIACLLRNTMIAYKNNIKRG
jgi:methylenetetrahydrofolate dehydrogenase (NADP+)/methenyltetrahydrofolate cyclohydrolase